MGQPSPCRPLPPSLLLLIPSSPARPPWGAPCSSAGSIAAMRRWSTTASPLPHSLRATGTRSCAPPARPRPRQRLGRPGCGRLLWVLLSPPTPPLIATGDAPPGVCATGEPLSFGLPFLRPAQPCLSLRRIAAVHWLMLTASRRSSPALPGDACVATVAAAVATATGPVASRGGPRI